MTAPEARYTSREIIARTPGMTYNKLTYWTNLHFVGTDDGAHPGIGHDRTWTHTDLRVIDYTTRLLDLGFALPLAASAARRHVETGKPVIIGDSSGQVVITFTDIEATR